MPLTRSPTGPLLYSESQLAARLRLPPPTAARRVAAYCRVSSASQRPGLRNYRRQLDAALKQDASHVAGPSHQA